MMGGDRFAFLDLVKTPPRDWPGVDRTTRERREAYTKAYIAEHGTIEGMDFQMSDEELVEQVKFILWLRAYHPTKAGKLRPTITNGNSV